MESFKGVSPHRPLANEYEFRVVIVHPGEFGEPVVCELEHISLEPNGDYEAVSYVWGDATVTKSITLHGQVYPVTTNLYTGLQYLRDKKSSRRLWIDSLCINQSDKTERSHEIQKMRDIYKYASQVLIWVGDYAPFSRMEVESIFEFVKELAAAFSPTELDDVIRRNGYDGLWNKQERLSLFVKSRGWFERIWVIQEVSVRPDPKWPDTKNSPRMQCGTLQLPIIYLREAMLWWVFFKDRDSQLQLPEVVDSVDRLHDIWGEHHTILSRDPDDSLPLGTCIAWIMAEVAGGFDATDPRDRIYAMIGLLPGQLPPILQPDYFKSTIQVFTEYTIYILESVGLINIIQYTSGLSEGFPSWVPDWKYASPTAVKPEAKRHPATHIRIVGDGKGLELDLLKFTEVKKCGPIFSLAKSNSDFTAALDGCVREVEDTIMPQQSYSDGIMRFRKRLYELLIRFDAKQRQITDCTWPSDASRKSLYNLPGYDEYLVWGSELTTKHSGGGKSASPIEAYYTEHLWRTVVATIENKYLFSCTDGSIGILAQSYVQPAEGDVVCSFKGACAEFVVRPCVGGYRLIGLSERTVRCLNSDIEDTDLASWVFPSYTLELLEPLWSTQPAERTTLW